MAIYKLLDLSCNLKYEYVQSFSFEQIFTSIYLVLRNCLLGYGLTIKK